MATAPDFSRKCVVCGNSLEGRRSDAKTCSGACRAKLSREELHAAPDPVVDEYVFQNVTVEQASIANGIGNNLLPDRSYDSPEELAGHLGRFIDYVLQPPVLKYVIQGFDELEAELISESVEFEMPDDGYEVETTPSPDLQEMTIQAYHDALRYPDPDDE